MNARSLAVRAEAMALRETFAISRGAKTEAHVVVAEIAEGEARGRGECVPYGRYGETVAGVVGEIEGMAGAVADGLHRIGLLDAMPAGAARNALDCALWDLEAKLAHRRAWELAGIAAPEPAETCDTVVLGTAQAMNDAARARAHRPLLKVKLDSEDVLARIRAVHAAAPEAGLVLDANEGWDLDVLESVAAELPGMGVIAIEQPLPADKDDGLADFNAPVSLIADESFLTAADLDRLTGKYAMVNLKLDKAGGLTAALAQGAAARERGLGVMVGCMVASSLGVAPATLLTADAELVDLDGPLWLAEDRAHGLDFSGSRVHAPTPALWG